jgi:catechol 2,3-dioxygenase-like lactoylglutathione lyase family enzyme
MNLQVIDHVGLNVRSLDTSFAFYERLFGFEVMHRWATSWLIRKGDLKIGLFQRPNGSPVCDLDQTLGITHVAFRTDPSSFDEAARELAALGVTFDPPQDTGVAMAMFILDPDGHQIEITSFHPDLEPSTTEIRRSQMQGKRECCRPLWVRA